MSIRRRLDHRARVTRRVTVLAGVTTVLDSIGSWTSIALTTPEEEAFVGDDSPRTLAPYVVGWAQGYRGFQIPLQAGCRLEAAGIGELELLTPPEALKEAAAGTSGWRSRAQLVSVLYPLTGEQQEQGGDTVGDIEVAIWDETEQQESPSRYENYDAEVPPEYSVVKNQQIVMDGRIYRVVETARNLAGPRTVLVLRTQSNG